MIQAIDHIGIAVRSVEAAIPRYEKMLGIPCSQIQILPEHGVKTAFFNVGESRLELLEATSPTSPIARFIEKRGEGLHHIAFRSSSVEGDLHQAVQAGCEHLSGISTEGAHGGQVAFLHPRSLAGVLVELCGPAGV